MAGFQFYQTEAAQGPRRRQRAPMRFGQHSHGQTEGDISALGMILDLAAEGCELGVHFHPRAQQQNIALKSYEVEELKEPIDGSRRLQSVTRLVEPGS